MYAEMEGTNQVSETKRQNPQNQSKKSKTMISIPVLTDSECGAPPSKPKANLVRKRKKTKALNQSKSSNNSVIKVTVEKPRPA